MTFHCVQLKPDFFIRNLEIFGKITIGLAVVIFYGRFQGLIIQDNVADYCGVLYKGTDPSE